MHIGFGTTFLILGILYLMVISPGFRYTVFTIFGILIFSSMMWYMSVVYANNKEETIKKAEIEFQATAHKIPWNSTCPEYYYGENADFYHPYRKYCEK